MNIGNPFYEWNIINEQILQMQDWNQWDQNNDLNNNSSWQANLNQLIDKATQATGTGTGAGSGAGSGATNPGIIAAGNLQGATLSQQITTALAESAVSTTASTAVQSAMTGESFSESLKSQAQNILIGAIGNLAAKGIGSAAHGSITKNADGTLTYTPPSISGTQQLALHAALGCGMAAAGGNDCASGAVSGMVGEKTGEYLRDSGVDKQLGTQLAGLAGGASAIFTGNAVGLDDQEIANNIFSGSRIGGNAAANNAYFIGGKVKIPFPGSDYDIHAGVQSNALFREDSIGTDGRGTNFLIVPEIGAGMYVYTVPHGHSPSVSTSWGYRNTISADYIRTDQGGYGFGYTVGISTAPVTVVPVNVSVSIPEKK